jgi:hypothetical protein
VRGEEKGNAMEKPHKQMLRVDKTLSGLLRQQRALGAK